MDEKFVVHEIPGTEPAPVIPKATWEKKNRIYRVELAEPAKRMAHWRHKVCAVFLTGPADLLSALAPKESEPRPVEFGQAHKFELIDLEPGTPQARRRMVCVVEFDKDAWSGYWKSAKGTQPEFQVYGFGVVQILPG